MFSHVESVVERGISINQCVVEHNRSPNTMAARRIIKDHMLRRNLIQQSITLESILIKSVKSSAERYKLALEVSKKKQKTGGTSSGSSDS